MEIESEVKRLQFYKLLKEIVIPQLFEGYFQKVFEYRDKEDEWTFKSPVDDLFHPFGKETKEEVEKVFIFSIVPNARIYWDILLAAYSVFAPTVFPTSQHVARCLYELLNMLEKQIGLDPQSIKNYGNEKHPEKGIHSFMGKYAYGEKLEGGNYNLFLVDPVAAVFLVKRIEVLMARKFSGNETDEELDGILWQEGFDPETKEPVEKPAVEILKELFEKTKKEVNSYFE